MIIIIDKHIQRKNTN